MEERIYSHKSGKTKDIYYLHKLITKRGGYLYYFSQKIVGGIPLPDGYEVLTNEYTGLPYLKKIK
jgi:hypothetical protein